MLFNNRYINKERKVISKKLNPTNNLFLGSLHTTALLKRFELARWKGITRVSTCCDRFARGPRGPMRLTRAHKKFLSPGVQEGRAGRPQEPRARAYLVNGKEQRHAKRGRHEIELDQPTSAGMKSRRE